MHIGGRTLGLVRRWAADSGDPADILHLQPAGDGQLLIQLLRLLHLQQEQLSLLF